MEIRKHLTDSLLKKPLINLKNRFQSVELFLIVGVNHPRTILSTTTLSKASVIDQRMMILDLLPTH